MALCWFLALIKASEKKRSAILASRLWWKRRLELEPCYFVYLNVKWLRQDISSRSSSQNKKYCGLCGSELIPKEANLNVYSSKRLDVKQYFLSVLMSTYWLSTN